MTSLGECEDGGWTLMMKINGSQVREMSLGWMSVYCSDEKKNNSFPVTM